MLSPILLLVIAYFIGSINPAYILTKTFKKRDIRKIGSKNPGTKNIYERFGLLLAIPVFLIDAGKGFLVILLAYNLNVFNLIIIYLAGLLTIIGHNWSIFLNFKGGRGFAATIGLSLATIFFFKWYVSIALIYSFSLTAHLLDKFINPLKK